MKVKGSSLLESLIALVILITVLTISLNSIVFSSSAEKNTLQSKAKFTLEQLEAECIKRKNYKSETFYQDGLEYEVNISFVNRYDGIIKVQSKASLESKVLAETVKYLSTKND